MYDVTIIGAGIIGLTAAKAMADLGLSVLIVDKNSKAKQWNEKLHPYGRIHAYNKNSIAYLTSLGVWQALPYISKTNFHGMYVLCQSEQIDFTEQDMGCFVSSTAMISTLITQLSQMRQVEFIWECELTEIIQAKDLVTLISNQGKLRSSFVIAADGARSWVRKKLALPVKTFNYQQKCFVGFLEFDGEHNFYAWQDFQANGTFGLLPYTDKLYSLALSVDNDTANNLNATNIIEYLNTLEKPESITRFTKITQLQSFPLHALSARKYFEQRVVMAGDAAHAIHPLAGLGLNLGIADAKALAKHIDCHIKNNTELELAFTRYMAEQSPHNNDIMDALTFMQQTFAGKLGSTAIKLAQNTKIKQTLMAVANQKPLYMSSI